MERNKIIIKNAHTNNLKNIDVEIPKHKLVVFTGVSGSGKSSLLFDTLYTEAQRQLIETFSTFARTRMPKLSRPDVDDIQNLSTAIMIDQKRMGKNLRSTVGTATEINTYLRLLYSRIGKPFIGPSFYFSFNHPEGMCPHCNGLGKQIKIDLDLFLDSVKTICDECEGKRYHTEVLELNYHKKNIADVLDMTVNQADNFFQSSTIKSHLQILKEVGLGYLKLGQPLSSLSGGESQRLKIATELNKESNIYIMDEPTTGLHMSDIDNFYRIVRSLVDINNTVIIIEHNLDIIRYADWIIDVGPGGGRNGGEIIAEGTPEEIIQCANSVTGRYLRRTI